MIEHRPSEIFPKSLRSSLKFFSWPSIVHFEATLGELKTEEPLAKNLEKGKK
jgi:hypothetical protein